MLELVNETVGRWRSWGYCYYVVDRNSMLEHSAYIVLPKDSYMYRARIAQKIVWIVQVPLGSATTQFLLAHGSSVVCALPSVLQR
jgi:hypothetical protein